MMEVSYGRKVKIHEAMTHLSILLQRVMNGGRIIITIASKLEAVLPPIEGAPETRIPGNDVAKSLLRPISMSLHLN
jgi:antitoxin (DNA-binding transcriptional repressor) of toxin-antitoxin stability system